MTGSNLPFVHLKTRDEERLQKLFPNIYYKINTKICKVDIHYKIRTQGLKVHEPDIERCGDSVFFKTGDNSKHGSNILTLHRSKHKSAFTIN